MVEATSLLPTVWRIEVRWTDDAGPRGGVLTGIDAGSLGTWEVDATGPTPSVRPASGDGVRTRLALLLPPATVVDRRDPPTTRRSGHPA